MHNDITVRSYKRQATFIVKYIENLLKDIRQWKINVFEEKDAIDVYYINASILNSALSLKELIKQNNLDA